MDIDGYPEALFKPEKLTAEAFVQQYPFEHRFVRSALRPDVRDWRLTAARRLKLPFRTEAALWSFDLRPGDDGDPIKLAMFWVGGGATIVDFTDTCIRAINPDHALSGDELRAHVATCVAMGKSRRRRIAVASKFADIVRPDGVDEAFWEKAAKAFAEGEVGDGEELLAFWDGRRGRIGKLIVTGNGSSQEEMLIEDRALRRPSDDKWVNDAGRGWYLADTAGLEDFAVGRRADRFLDTVHAIEKYQDWRPDGFEGDVAEVQERARALFDKRRDTSDWQVIYPSEDQRAAGETAALFDELHRRQPDYTVPEECNGGQFRASERHPHCPIQVRRRLLSFYPAHRLYEIADRRGGRPRRTQVLFAPDRATMPEGVDGLIPLDGTAFKAHILNEAYSVKLRADDVPEYLAFFCDTLTAVDGLFHIVESVNRVRWRGLSEQQQASLADVVAPIRLWPGRDDENHVVDGTITYGGALFHAVFHVAPTGMVSMPTDTALAERLEIAPETYSAKTHFFLRAPIDFQVPARWRHRTSLADAL